MNAVDSIRGKVGVRAACTALGVSSATYYRRSRPTGVRQNRRSPRRLTDEERAEVLERVNTPRFADQPVTEVHATLLEESVYLCSERTMYRILAENKQVRERRNQLRHPKRAVPRLVARGPREVWTWDITKLPGPFKWSYYYLYVILDIYSRYVVGWMIAHRETAALAERLIRETCEREGIEPETLTLHADRGSPMKSKVVGELLADLGVAKSHSRPRVSNDNPYSESQFKTLKYQPGFPERFDSAAHARWHGQDFFGWYNEEHHHVGLAMMTPADVHFGRVDQIVATKQAALDGAYARTPHRFPNGPPCAKRPPVEVWINRPDTSPATHVSRTSHAGSGNVNPDEGGERSERRVYIPEPAEIITGEVAGRRTLQEGMAL